MKVLKFDEISIEDIVYHPPKSNAMGGQSVSLSYNDEKLIFQIPKCKLPFGLGEYVPPGGQVKHSLDLALSGKSEQFATFLQKLDAHHKTMAVKHSPNWFKKRLTEDIVSELYRPQLRKNGDYVPNFKVKFPTKDGVPLCDVFDKSREEANLDIITKGCEVQTIVECVGIYFVAREFGVTWKVLQLRVFPTEKLPSYAFIESEDDEDAEPVN